MKEFTIPICKTKLIVISTLVCNLILILQANSVCLWSWCSSELDPSFEDSSVNPGEEVKGAEPELLATFAHNIGDVNDLQVSNITYQQTFVLFRHKKHYALIYFNIRQNTFLSSTLTTFQPIFRQ
jgi:hypothetical protein